MITAVEPTVGKRDSGQALAGGDMGKVVTRVELFSCGDEEMVERGQLRADQIRRDSIEALADTGATLMSIPQDVIDKLGVRVFSERVSRFANGETAVKKISGPVHIRVMGRDALVVTMATHPGLPSLLGQIPLESLDLLVDPKRQRLIAGHPDYPNEQLIECY